jgi:IstB-like ATP binding protein
VAQLAKAHSEGRLEDRLTHFGKPKLLIVDELGYLPFEPNAAARPAHLAHRLRGPAREHRSIRPPRYSRYLRLHARRQWLRWDRQAMCGDLHWAGREESRVLLRGIPASIIAIAKPTQRRVLGPRGRRGSRYC